MRKPMAAKQQAFVEEYLKDLNATAAAIRAGYSPRSARQVASVMLTTPRYAKVQDAIAIALAERSIRTQVDVDYVVRNATEVLERCMQRAPVMERAGREVAQATDEDGKHIWQFDSKGANTALTLLAKHLGMLVDKKEITLPAGAGVLAVPVAPDSAQWAAGAKAQQTALMARPTSEGGS